MARKLPWLTKATSTPSEQAPITPVKRKRAISPMSDGLDLDLPGSSAASPASDDLDLNLTSTTTNHKSEGHSSSPSYSPSVGTAPEVVYMKEGFDADDRYIMVEDEFFSTAQLFTRHLHHEEYMRLKRLAKSRMRDTIENMERPTDSTTKQNIGMQLKLQASGIARSIRNNVKEGVVTDRTHNKGSKLGCLMSERGLVSIDLSTLLKKKPRTNAAVCLDKTQSAREDALQEDQDDLGGQPSSRIPIIGSRHTADANDRSEIVKALTAPENQATSLAATESNRSTHLTASADNRATPLTAQDTRDRTVQLNASSFLARRREALAKKQKRPL